MRDPKFKKGAGNHRPGADRLCERCAWMPDEDIAKMTGEEERELKNAMGNLAKYRLVDNGGTNLSHQNARA